MKLEEISIADLMAMREFIQQKVDIFKSVDSNDLCEEHNKMIRQINSQLNLRQDELFK